MKLRNFKYYFISWIVVVALCIVFMLSLIGADAFTASVNSIFGVYSFGLIYIVYSGVSAFLLIILTIIATKIGKKT